MTEKKITKKEFYAGIIEAMQTGNSPIAPDEVIAFCENEIALLDKKAEKAKARAAAKRAEGDELTDTVKSVMSTDKFEVIGGVMNGQKVSVATIQELAALPSLDELRGKLVGLLVAPAGAIARVCKAYSEKEEQAA